LAIRRFGKDQVLYKKLEESTTNELFQRISKLDKSVMVAQHNKLAKQILENVHTYSKMGLHPWECLTIIEDITQDVLRKWEVYHEEKKYKEQNKVQDKE